MGDVALIVAGEIRGKVSNTHSLIEYDAAFINTSFYTENGNDARAYQPYRLEQDYVFNFIKQYKDPTVSIDNVYPILDSKTRVRAQYTRIHDMVNKSLNLGYEYFIRVRPDIRIDSPLIVPKEKNTIFFEPAYGNVNVMQDHVFYGDKIAFLALRDHILDEELLVAGDFTTRLKKIFINAGVNVVQAEKTWTLIRPS